MEVNIVLMYKHNMRYSDEYVAFWRNNTPFSNFYKQPFTYKGHKLQYSEQGFMLEKAELFDKSKIPLIVAAKRPEQVKAIGRSVENYDDEVWKAHRYQAMVDVLKSKFQHPTLRAILLDTGDRVLVEASPYDRVWGVGLTEDDPNIFNPEAWQGTNLLGRALMEVRESLKR